jgi:hypothetical protein
MRRSQAARKPSVGASAEELPIGRQTIRLTNPDKVLYPRTGFTKRQVVDYYIAVARYLVPHLHDRPVTLKRYPNGTRGQFFYEKDAPTFTPDWVKTFPVPRRAGGPDINYIVINDVATLAWCATVANLEVHPFLQTAVNAWRSSNATSAHERTSMLSPGPSRTRRQDSSRCSRHRRIEIEHDPGRLIEVRNAVHIERHVQLKPF